METPREPAPGRPSHAPDASALELALAALRPRLRRFAYGLCGSMDDADDLVQAAYQRALERLHQWREGSRLDSWMYRIVQSIHFNRRRAERVRNDHLAALAAASAHAPDAAQTVDPAHAVEGQIALERVRKCVWKLPEEQRACLLLVVVEGLSYQETGDVLGVPVGTVTSRLARARATLRSSIDGSGGPDVRESAA